MADQRPTFAKRQREQDKRDKARAKEARRAAKRIERRARANAPNGDGASVDGAPPSETPAVNPTAAPGTGVPPPAAGLPNPIGLRNPVDK
jgi:hypothetical protein